MCVVAGSPWPSRADRTACSSSGDSGWVPWPSSPILALEKGSEGDRGISREHARTEHRAKFEFHRFLVPSVEEEGQALVEYGLIISLVALVVVGILATVGTDVPSVFSQIAGKL